MQEEKSISNMQLDGGIACLDFINTQFTSGAGVGDRLTSYNDVLVLSERVFLFPGESIKQLKKLAAGSPEEAEHNAAQARYMRGVMTAVFTPIALGANSQFGQGVLAEFHNQVSAAFSRQQLVYKDDHLTWDFGPNLHLAAPADAFLLSAYNLLRDPGLQRLVKKCAGCDWLFLDITKNHRRKWCDMQTCGSSHKSKTYYQKKIRSKRTGGQP
ncbi:hypothetical protein EXU57_20295 [Segetibacter sp. 3557_3]|uniref:CGNR zinc finger domain-containing protein n=1 Tax=Segetibacter sp. 3557_3 TaxID=2547429 RepID=UPI001058B7E7|nr:CGNR zinc finger domain-containing protein [Segetibacter sp. 3557_3]TDH21283.1 hypothetical protein EXU57_20295 [Segetibacter sp. 3557_3]